MELSNVGFERDDRDAVDALDAGVDQSGLRHIGVADGQRLCAGYLGHAAEADGAFGVACHMPTLPLYPVPS